MEGEEGLLKITDLSRVGGLEVWHHRLIPTLLIDFVGFTQAVLK